eukprot:2591802-Pyramimonas_sp.AAC.1
MASSKESAEKMQYWSIRSQVGGSDKQDIASPSATKTEATRSPVASGTSSSRLSTCARSRPRTST